MNMKAAASLTGSLLARKGAAYPAAYSAPSTAPSASPPDSGSDDHQPQRAYNDPRVIASAPPQAVPPATSAPQYGDGRFPSPGHTPETAETPLAAETPPATEAPEATAPVRLPTSGEDALSIPQAMDKMGRVRLSVRLDPDRYLRVKMASARTRWSAQDIVIAALDRYLGEAQGGSPSPRASDGAASGAGESERDDEDSVN